MSEILGKEPIIDEKPIINPIAEKYAIRSNTYIATEKADVKDLIQVEIGDSKQVDFYPQVKVMRWQNEVNFSARLVDDSIATVGTANESIVWSTDKRDANFYSLPATEEYPEGGYEFEITLKERPATNRTSFTIQTKGLDFLFQPFLTEEEKASKRRRCAENVEGSYAVYYRDCPLNYAGGKEYRAGKAFHIYRPRIEDAKGNWIWGDLVVDVDAGLLYVDIDEKWLDSAVYPVRHAAGLTFGYTTKGASYSDMVYHDSSYNHDQYRIGMPGQPASDGSISKISLALCDSWSNSDSNTFNIKVFVNEKGSNNNRTQVATASNIGFSGVGSYLGTWVDTNISYNALSSKVYIINTVGDISPRDPLELAVFYDSSAGAEYYNSGSGSAYTTPESPWACASSTGFRYSIYATYTASGEGTDVSVTAVKATSTSDSKAPTVTATSPTNISVTGVKATSTNQAVAPIVTSTKTVSITGVKATSTNLAPVPVVTATKTASITSMLATSASSAPVPAVAGVQNATVTSVLATSTSDATAPTVDTIQNPTVIGVVATSSSDAKVPIISTAGTVNIGAATALATSDAKVSAVVGQQNISITSGLATTSTQTIAPVVVPVRNSEITSVLATASAEAKIPAILAITNITITVLPATNTSESKVPVVVATIAAKLKMKVGGAWVDVVKSYVKVSGVWKEIDTVYTKVDGVWKTG